MTLKRPVLFWAVALVLLALSYLYTPNSPPLPSGYLEFLAIMGWGAAALVIAFSTEQPAPVPGNRKATTLLYALILAPAAAIGLDMAARPYSYPMLALGTILVVVCALLAAHAAIQVTSAAAAGSSTAMLLLRSLAWALVAVGAVNGLLGLLQYVQAPLPTWLMSELVILGRSYGNLRQPNLYVLLLIWTYLALLGLLQARLVKGEMPRSAWLGWGGIALLICAGIAVSGSRTGGLFLWLIAAVGLFMPNLRKSQRIFMLGAAVLHALLWAGLVVLDRNEVLPFYSTLRTYGGAAFEREGFSNSRLSVWKDVWDLIQQRPWVGYGFYRLNHELTLSDLPKTPLLNLLHAHNIVLQWAFEFGLVAAVAWLVLALAWAWSVRRALRTPWAVWLALALALASVHNLLEFPWWHAHFMLPSAFAAGVLAALAVQERTPGASEGRTQVEVLRQPRLLVLGGALMIAGGIHAALDHKRVEPIYRAGVEHGPLMARLESAYGTVWFRHWVDQAVVGTLRPNPTTATVHCRLGKKAQTFYLGAYGALNTAMACAQEDESYALKLVAAVRHAEPHTLEVYMQGLDETQKPVFERLLRAAPTRGGN